MIAIFLSDAQTRRQQFQVDGGAAIDHVHGSFQEIRRKNDALAFELTLEDKEEQRWKSRK